MNGRKLATLTGIKDTNMMDLYVSYLEQFGYTYTQNLADADLLVVASVFTQNFKIATYMKKPIKKVRLTWLIDSHQAQNQLPTRKYEITRQLFGSNIGIFGFEPEKTLKIIKIIQDLEGNVIQLKNLNNSGHIKLNLQQKSIELLITPRSAFSKLIVVKQENGSVQAPDIPCVGTQWLEASVIASQARYPLDYAYNYLTLKNEKRQTQMLQLAIEKQRMLREELLNPVETCPKWEQKEYPKQANNLANSKKKDHPNQSTQMLRNQNKTIKPALLASIRPSESAQSSPIFNDCYIYFHHRINPNNIAGRLLKPLVCMKNGLYLQFLSPLLTHIVVDQISQNQTYELMKYGGQAIVRVQWVINSILYNVRLNQRDYKVHSFVDSIKQIKEYVEAAEKMIINNQIMSAQYNLHKNNKITSNNQLSHTRHPSNSSFQKSISTPLVKQQEVKCKPVKIKAGSKSTIFKNITFVIPQKFRKEKQLKNIVTMIRQNGGVAYDKPKANTVMYCVLVDSHDIEGIFDIMRKGYEQFLRPVSYRWVQYCCKKQNFIQHNQKNYFVFKPFKLKTPVFGFLVCKFEIVGVDHILKLRIRQLLDQLGSKKINPSIMEITHCLCNDEKKISTFTDSSCKQEFEDGKQREIFEAAHRRINEIASRNSKVIYIKMQWVFDCLSTGSMIPIEQYKIDGLKLIAQTPLQTDKNL